MDSPEIPPKTEFLSSVIGGAALITESPTITPTPTKTEEEKPTEERGNEERVRPAVAPKPERLVVRLVSRPRSSTIATIPTEKEPAEVATELKPPILPRILRTPPPKPPRLSLSDISEVRETANSGVSAKGGSELLETGIEESNQNERQRGVEGSDTTDSEEFCDEEYDLTPYQSSQPLTPNTEVQPSSHRPAGRSMSHPVTSEPQQKPKAIILPPHVVPPDTTNIIERYHTTQAKHLPLFKPMGLAEIAKKYAKYFPMKIQIAEGHYGMSSKYSISTDDRFNLHFKKRMKQVTIRSYGEEYFIPLSTTIQFGLVYDPTNNTSVALEGHRFRRVADLMEANPLPKLVRVSSPCSCSNGEILEYNELLIVRKVKSNFFRGKPLLKVFSLLSGTKKRLPQDAIGNFSTKPVGLKMDLTKFMEQVPKPLPCIAMMFIERDEEEEGGTEVDDLPQNLFSWPVTLREVKHHESLVATMEKNSQLIDIPLQGNIGSVKANIVPPNSPEDIHELFRNTRTFLQQFDVTQVDIYGDFNTESAHNAQNTLYRMVRGSVKGLGIEVVTPEALRQQEEELYAETNSFTSSTSGDDPTYEPLPCQRYSEDEYETLEKVRPIITPTIVDNLDNHPLNIIRDYPIPTPRMIKPPISPRRRAETAHSGSGTIRYSQLLPPSPTPLVRNHRSISLVNLTPKESSQIEENKEYLRSLSITKVAMLLEDMNLGQYKQTFQEQQVSGDVLVDLTDAMLQSKELGVESDFHRLRLMKIIRGEPSAHRIIREYPSYCHSASNTASS